MGTATLNHHKTDSSRATTRFVPPAVSSAIRAMNAALVGIWPKGHAPRNTTASSLRAKIMEDQSNPARPCVVLTFAAIDEGKPVSAATKWARDLIDAAEQYAKVHVTAGILPFPQRFLRLWDRETQEQADADRAAMQVCPDNLEALERFEVEVTQHVDALVAQRELVRQRIAELRSRG